MKGKLTLKTATALAGLAMLVTWVLTAGAAPAMAYPMFTHLNSPLTTTRSTLETFVIAAIVTAVLVVGLFVGVALQRRAQRSQTEVITLDEARQQEERRKAA